MPRIISYEDINIEMDDERKEKLSNFFMMVKVLGYDISTVDCNTYVSFYIVNEQVEFLSFCIYYDSNRKYLNCKLFQPVEKYATIEDLLEFIK